MQGRNVTDLENTGNLNVCLQPSHSLFEYLISILFPLMGALTGTLVYLAVANHLPASFYTNFHLYERAYLPIAVVVSFIGAAAVLAFPAMFSASFMIGGILSTFINIVIAVLLFV